MKAPAISKITIENLTKKFSEAMPKLLPDLNQLKQDKP
jgi:hypothetical protein